MATAKQLELRKLLVKDLRTTKIRKGRVHMKKGKGPSAEICYLGMAQERYLKEFGTNGLTFFVRGDGSLVTVENGREYSTSLPPCVQKAFGFKDTSGSFTEKGILRLWGIPDTHSTMIGLNDSTSLTWTQLAAFTEANPGLFAD